MVRMVCRLAGARAVTLTKARFPATSATGASAATSSSPDKIADCFQRGGQTLGLPVGKVWASCFPPTVAVISLRLSRTYFIKTTYFEEVTELRR